MTDRQTNPFSLLTQGPDWPFRCLDIVNEVLGREKEDIFQTFLVAIRGGTVDNLEPPQNGLQILPRVHLVWEYQT